MEGCDEKPAQVRGKRRRRALGARYATMEVNVGCAGDRRILPEIFVSRLLIVNLAAGQRRPDDLLAQLSRAFPEPRSQIVATERAGHAEALAREAVERGGYQAIVVGGGDGTINEAVNGILNAGGDHPRPRLGILPLGTCNVLATELGIPSGPM